MAATIRDIAKIAKVSTATVSRVINNDDRVTEKTAQIVRDAIKQCNYVPNTNARSLKSSTSKTIGLMISDLSNSYFSVMAKRLETDLRKQGYGLLICSTDEDGQQELDNLNKLLGQQIDGLILNTTGFNDEKIIEISKTLPLVLLERNISTPGFVGDYVSSNNKHGMLLLTETLLKKGHTRIGIINSGQQISTSRERYEGFCEAMSGAGITIDDTYPYVFNSDTFSFNGGYAGCRHLMNMPTPPTAIITTNVTLAIGALRYIRQNNIHVPEDLSFVTYGDIENSELFFIDVGHSTLSPISAAEKAGNFILSRIKDPSLGNRECVFEPSVLENGTVSVCKS